MTNKKINSLFSRLTPGVSLELAQVFVTSAALLVLYRFFCTGKFYRKVLSVSFDIDPTAFFGFGLNAWKGISTFLLLGVTALLVGRLLDKNKLQEIGFALGDWRNGLKWTGIFLAVMIPVVIAAGFFSTFTQKYPLAKSALDSYEAFIVFEGVMLLYFIGWEFFFRGYMLFTLHKHLGNIAVFIQMVPFALLHGSKPLPEALGAIIVGIVLGYFALHTRSFVYCALIHFLVALTMDIVAAVHKIGF
ncbi:MAG: CPBP family intramembrane metalloprotease [Proteobacteria bacterium]|nr:CPBP family intramembrane metalloprotease [Pseudomonadota bacterium]